MTEEFEKMVSRRLANLETHIINLIIPTQELVEKLGDKDSIDRLVAIMSTPRKVESEKFERYLKDKLEEFSRHCNSFMKFSEDIDISNTLAEIRYIGKRLKAIELEIKDIKSKDLDKKINVKFSIVEDEIKESEILKKEEKKGKRK